ncbi:MAG: hypothetical protein ABI723_10905 [Bacteroidia bacterium]
MSEDDNNIFKVSEPYEEYPQGKTPSLSEIYKTIKVASFEELEEERRQFSISLNYTQRMQLLCLLNKMTFAEQLKNPEKLWTKEIIIDSYDGHIS